MNTNETLDTLFPIYKEADVLLEIQTAMRDYFIARFEDDDYNSFLFTLPNRQTFRVTVNQDDLT